ncbi:hypothetical protein [Catenulispora yoronensis]|uniref:hypothetical protein n=1 Tax=Catenulispora yoronensis TaxID=450799 RepID=UPI0031D5ACF0
MSQVLVLLVAVLTAAVGCGADSSKPQAIAGCDAGPASPDVGLRFITRELRALNLVTGEPRLAQFHALFDGEKVIAESVPMIEWYSKYGTDHDISIYGMVPEAWDTVLDRHFANPMDEYRAYCTGWSFDAFARAHAVNPNG